jgi:predicted MFS family arabinose efflux permease
LVRGNSVLEGSRSAAQIGGPALGGALVSLLSAPIAVASSALFFALSFLSVRRIRRTESDPGALGTFPSVWRQIHEGLRFVAGDSSLRAVCLASAAFQFSFAATMTVYLLFLPRELHLSGTAVGLALAATGPGALVGSLLAARLPSRFGYGRVLVLRRHSATACSCVCPRCTVRPRRRFPCSSRSTSCSGSPGSW